MRGLSVLRVIWALIKPFLKYVNKDAIEKAIEYARRFEDTTMTGEQKRQMVASMLRSYIDSKYDGKVPKWILNFLIELALFAFKRSGRE